MSHKKDARLVCVVKACTQGGQAILYLFFKHTFMIYLQNIEEYNYIRPVRDYLDLQNFIDSDEYTITADKLTSAVANVSIIAIFQVRL